MDNIYKVKVRCKNCGKEQEVEIEKGKLVHQKECPNCGCINCLERIPGAKFLEPRT